MVKRKRTVEAPALVEDSIDLLALGARLMELFPSNPDVYGQYTVSDDTAVEPGEKRKGSAKTVTGRVVLEHWLEHLRGRVTLGLVPVMPDGTAGWAAVDVDVYDPDYDRQSLVTGAYDAGLLPERSKSGGLHLYAFFKERIQAKAVRAWLKRVAADLGVGGSEIWPKQDRVLVEAGDKGNWLNMPYYGLDSEGRAKRCGLTRELQPMSVIDFLSAADAMRIDPSEVTRRRAKPRAGSADDGREHQWIPDGPPCLQTLTTAGFPKGSMNNALFNLAVYYRRANPDDWEQMIEEANKRWMRPGSSAEVQNIIRSMRKKGYSYKCEEEPICSHCNRDVCMTRRYGVGLVGAELPTLEGLVKLDSKPPVYFVTVNETRVGPLDADSLMTASKFERYVFESNDLVMPVIKPVVWRNVLGKLLEDLQIVSVPHEAGNEGQLFEYLEAFITSAYTTEDAERLLLGNVYSEEDRRYFRLSDFVGYLNRQRFFAYQRHEIAALLTRAGVKHTTKKVKGRCVNVWVANGVTLLKGLDNVLETDKPY